MSHCRNCQVGLTLREAGRRWCTDCLRQFFKGVASGMGVLIAGWLVGYLRGLIGLL